jgi:sugar lactone lactonase YvrE
MNANVSKPANLPRRDGPISRRLFFLDLAAGRVLSVNTDGSDLKVLVEEGRKLPDGLAVDAGAGYLYLGNMGNLKADDGEILRYDLDGGHMTTIVPPGATFTPKQLAIDNANDKLYWSDREHAGDACQPGWLASRDSGRHERG